MLQLNIQQLHAALIMRCRNNTYVFSQAKYCDTHFIYVFCNGNVRPAVE